MRQVTRKGLITAAATGGWLVLSGGVADADAGAAGTSTASPGALSGNTIQVPIHIPVNVCGNSLNVVGALNPAFGTACTLGAPGEPGGPAGSGSPVGSGSRGAGGAGAVGEASRSPGVASGNTVEIPVQAPVNVCGNSANVVGGGNAANAALSGTCANQAPVARPQPAPPAARPSPASGAPESGGRAGRGEGGGRGQQVDRPSAGKPAPHVPGQREGGGRGQQVDRPSTAEPARQVSGGPLRTAHAPAASHRERAGGQLAATGGGPALNATLPLGAGLLTGGVVLYRRAALARRR